MRILIIGTSHNALQVIAGTLEAPENRCRELYDYVQAVIKEQAPDLLAEELNQEGLERMGAERSVLQKISEEKKIKHILADPNSAERKKLGIPSHSELVERLGFGSALTSEQSAILSREIQSYWPIREKFWLDKIMENRYETCLVVVGANHCKSFADLCRSKSIEVTTLAEDFGEEPDQIEAFMKSILTE